MSADSGKPPIGEPVVVGSFYGPMEADMACARLEAEGIEAAILDDNVVLMDPLMTYAVGGVKVVVAPDDAAKAAAILGARRKPAEPVACPECGSTDVHLGKRWTFLAILALGFPIGRARPKHRCNACGHTWRG